MAHRLAGASLALLCLILVLAGAVHLLDPFAFVDALPPFVPAKLELIFWSGIFELALALGLAVRSTRQMTALVTALYFTLLIPVHVYVSWFAIPMFGIRDPALLWSRTAFQFVFIWWAWSLRKV
jgi:uncharacterized membrane protein